MQEVLKGHFFATMLTPSGCLNYSLKKSFYHNPDNHHLGVTSKLVNKGHKRLLLSHF